MARVFTVDERAILASPHVITDMKVDIKRVGSAVWVDMTTLLGVDWVNSATYGTGVDDFTWAASFSLAREANGISLSPYMSASPANLVGGVYEPLVHIGNRIRIRTRCYLPGTVPPAFREVFLGVIDDVIPAGDAMTVDARDEGAYLMDAQVETERVYGTTGGAAVESVMQLLLDQTIVFDSSGVLVHTPVSPAWLIQKYKQSRVRLGEALRALAMQIGWTVRYMWTSADQFELTFFAPNREATVANYTFTKDEYRDVTDLRTSREDIRNVVEVTFLDEVTQQVASEKWQDDDSILRYGRRYMEIAEGSSSNISSSDEALNMAQRAVHDLSEPEAEQEIKINYFWPAEPCDLAGFVANGVHFSDDQKFGVISVRHELTRDEQLTYLRTRGKVAGAYQNWLRLEGRGFRRNATTPFPDIGSAFAEGSADGGAFGGMVWLPVKFDRNTKRVRAFAAQSPNAPCPAPELSNRMQAWDLQRQDGKVAGASEWQTYLYIATNTGWDRKIVIYAEGPDGDRSSTIMREIVAVDPPGNCDPGSFSSAGAVRSGTNNILKFTKDVAGTSDYPILTLIVRNGVIIAALEAAAAGVEDVFSDEDLVLDIPYTYEFVPWTQGVSGVRLAAQTGVTVTPPTDEPPPTTTPETPTTTDPDPSSFDYAPTWVTKPFYNSTDDSVDMLWSTPAGPATHVQLEFWDGMVGSSWRVMWATAPTNPTIVNVGVPGQSGYYRLRSMNGATFLGLSSPARYFEPLARVGRTSGGTSNPL